MQGAVDDPRTGQGHVFLSYSRKDSEFTRGLHDALTALGRKTWADWEGIPPSDKWMARIHAAIDEAEAVLFIISPDSLDSTVCGEELDFSFGRNKRVIPVMHREPRGEVRADLAELNWIFARPSDDLNEAVSRIIEAVDTDLGWVRAHTRLLVRAAEWDRRERDASYTLRGRDLRDFETLQAEGTDKEPRLTRLQSEYLLASRRATTRRQQLTWTGVTVAVIVASVLGTFAWLQSQERLRQAEIAGARRLVSQAEVLREAPQEEQIERRNGLRAAAEALATLHRVGADWTDADRALRLGYASVDKWRDPFTGHDDWQVDNAAFGADPRHVLFYTRLNELVLLDVVAGKILSECQRMLEDQTESRGAANRLLALSPDARHAALLTSGGTNRTGSWSRIEIWDLDACAQVAKRQINEGDRKTYRTLLLTADAKAVIYGTERIARAWSFSAGEVVDLAVPPGTRDLVVAPDGQRAVAYIRRKGERTRKARVFDLESGEVEAEWALEGSPDRLAWTEGGILVSRSGKTVVLDPEGNARGTLAAVPMRAPAFNQDGELMALWTATASDDGKTKVEVEVLSVATGEQVARAVRDFEIVAVAFAERAEALIVVGAHGFDVELWSFRETGAYARLTLRGEADRIGFQTGGGLLHADLESTRASWRLPAAAGQPPESVPEDETVEPPPPATGVTAPVPSGAEFLSAAVAAPDRRARLVCIEPTRGGCRRLLEVWEGGEKRASLNLEPVFETDRSAFLQFAGNDDLLVVATRTGLEILVWPTLESVGEIFVHDVRHAEVAPELDRAATSGADGTIRVWQLSDNTEVARIEPEDGLRDMALSDDGRWLAVLSRAGDRIDLHALAPGDLVAQACRWLEPPCP